MQKPRPLKLGLMVRDNRYWILIVEMYNGSFHSAVLLLIIKLLLKEKCYVHEEIFIFFDEIFFKILGYLFRPKSLQHTDRVQCIVSLSFVSWDWGLRIGVDDGKEGKWTGSQNDSPYEGPQQVSSDPRDVDTTVVV